MSDIYAIVIRDTANILYTEFTAYLLPTHLTATGETPYEAVQHVLNVAKVELTSLNKLNKLNELDKNDILGREKELLENFYGVHNNS